MQDKQKRMKELVALLREASRVYYAEDREMMSNLEYDRLYDELLALEEETGIVLAGSPTHEVGYEAVEELPKERHESPMLSLDKTKDREALRDWLNGQEALLSWKLDGLTVVLTYRDGTLQKAVTRGNGEVGEVITANARTFKNLPTRISFRGELVLRGEAVIGYSDFDKLNDSLPEGEARYKNPRNLCSGSVRQLDSAVTAARNVQFFAFSLVRAEGEDFDGSMEKQFLFLQGQGFDTVFYRKVNPETIIEAVNAFERDITDMDVPSDGLVLSLEDLVYGASLGRTAKFPRNAIAFKWQDELAETTLLDMEWSPSRTGLINPVAIFEPVELEGTTVSRASVHNLSIVKALQLGIGDRITVYKANMIIPQIGENLTRSDNLEIPACCPCCGAPAERKKEADSEVLMCGNPECAAKQIKSFSHFVSRDAMNIDGLSEATLEKLIEIGAVRSRVDLFRLEAHREAIVSLEGFGDKSFKNLTAAAEKARHCTLPAFIFGLGINGVGLAVAKLICAHFEDDFEALAVASEGELSEIDGVGPVLANSVAGFFADEKKMKDVRETLQCLQIQKRTFLSAEETANNPVAGKSFVVTGSLAHFASRKELKELIESKGGKVASAVSNSTECLINNDATSGSSKNKTAKSLGIPILTEEEFLEKYMQE